MKITNVCILGAGTLGTRIALQAALSGFQVKIYDINAEAFISSKKVMSKILRSLSPSSQCCSLYTLGKPNSLEMN